MSEAIHHTFAARLAARMSRPFARRGTRDAAPADRSRHAVRIRVRALIRSFSRRQFRDNEVALIVLAGVLGFLIGLSVVAVREIMQWMHETNFAMPPDRLLSEGLDPIPWRDALVPVIGGLAIAIAVLLIRRWRPREIVDAIEANALYGGKMSLIDSVNLAVLTLLSGGFGASVGLEAAYTQLGAGFASNCGEALRVRRQDLRTLVGCGAAAAIAAAFNAPLAGAFYAFELVIGSYSPTVLAPVGVAAITGTVAMRATLGPEPLFLVTQPIAIGNWDYLLFALLGLGAAALGIVTMLGVTSIERVLRRHAVPGWLRPILGGVVIGLIALVFPQVLGSGHGAVQHVLGHDFLPLTLLALVAAKALASAVSVGAGFRGGLFSSSLFLGSLYGGAAAGFMAWAAPEIHLDQLAYMIVGMGAVAASIVGAPVTMILLILELTADFYVAMGVMVGVIVASVVTRLVFGYSFATWRFHLRGVPIRGAFDVGWIRDLTVEKIMRRDAHCAPADTPLAELRKKFPLGGTKRIFLTDPQGRYAGLVNTPDLYDPDRAVEGGTAESLRRGETQFLLPQQNIRVALDRFLNAEMEVLPVVAGTADHAIVGFVTEAYALRRYNQELERAGGSGLGDSSLFGAV
ncbi:MAG TPA: chloride channel protein [Stellaceae bacterium]|nr:chloride channel protein [Stellaceae bacterium]